MSAEEYNIKFIANMLDLLDYHIFFELGPSKKMVMLMVSACIENAIQTKN